MHEWKQFLKAYCCSSRDINAKFIQGCFLYIFIPKLVRAADVAAVKCG